MNQDTLLLVMTIFVAVSAIALCIQMFLLLAIAKTAKTMQEQTASILPQAQSILAQADETIRASKGNVIEVTRKASEILDVAKAQMVKVDAVMTDASARAKVQLEKVELVVDDTVSRVHNTVTAVNQGVVRPIREIQGVAAGVRTAVAHLMRGGRPSVAQATQDDEMFI
jgi:F0F1-type ATP synthase membrane subunit b/b'